MTPTDKLIAHERAQVNAYVENARREARFCYLLLFVCSVGLLAPECARLFG